MVDVYPVYLKLGWKHSVSCVSRGLPRTRNTLYSHLLVLLAPTLLAPTRCTRHAYHAISRTSSSLASAAGATLAARRARSGFGLAAGGIAACPPRHSVGVKLYLYSYLSDFVPVYLAVYLVCICFQERNTQIHAYPHPSPSVSNI